MVVRLLNKSTMHSIPKMIDSLNVKVFRQLLTLLHIEFVKLIDFCADLQWLLEELKITGWWLIKEVYPEV